MTAKIRSAIASGQLEPSDALEKSQRAVAASLSTVEARLEQLQKTSEATWEDMRIDVDTAWEDLSRSVQKLVARLSDQSPPDRKPFDGREPQDQEQRVDL